MKYIKEDEPFDKIDALAEIAFQLERIALNLDELSEVCAGIIDGAGLPVYDNKDD